MQRNGGQIRYMRDAGCGTRQTIRILNRVCLEV